MKYLILLIALAANGCEANVVTVPLNIATTNVLVALNLEQSLSVSPTNAVTEMVLTNTIISQPMRDAVLDAGGQKVEHVGPEVRIVLTQVIKRQVLSLTWNDVPRAITNDVVVSETRIKQQKVEGWANQ